jgi:serine/threonine-protein kinase RsbW
MASTKHEFRLRVPSRTDNLDLIRIFVGKVAEKVGFQSDEVDKIELACDEACTNVVKHAYKREESAKSLDVAIKIDYQKLTIIVTDHGKSFDPGSVIMPKMKEYLAELRVGGLGIYLMRKLMDEVNYDIQPGVKNQVKMVKYFIDKQNSKSIKKIEDAK